MARWLLRWTESGRMAGLNLLTWLTAYLDECGRNGAEPLAGPALERFLHWNASPDDLQVWAQPPPAGKTRTNNIAAGTATANRHARPSACPLTGLPNTYTYLDKEHFSGLNYKLLLFPPPLVKFSRS